MHAEVWGSVIELGNIYGSLQYNTLTSGKKLSYQLDVEEGLLNRVKCLKLGGLPHSLILGLQKDHYVTVKIDS